MLATLVAITTHSLPVLIAASAMQGMGTGVGGVMARTLPRDLYEGAQLRHANSLLNMGILVSPLIAPLLGGILDTLWSWRACYAFLLVLCAGVTFSAPVPNSISTYSSRITGIERFTSGTMTRASTGREA